MSTIKPLSCKPGEVAVRMFCQGLGDCFLIGLGLEDGSTFKIIVDCGVIIGTPNATSLIAQVVDGLRASTGGTVDALVITHEHWDHVGGFSMAKDQWSKFKINEVWLAWTENRPKDAYAQQLYDEKAKSAAKLAFALQNVQNKLKASMGLSGEAEARQNWEDSTGYLAFLGLDSDQASVALGADESPLGKTEEALNIAKGLSKANKYFYPGDVKTIGKHFEIAFLGPPHNDQIKKPDDPGGKHTYKTKVIGFDDDGMNSDFLSDAGPFDYSYQIDYDEFEAAAKENPSLDILKEYESESQAWRKLDLDANQLALDLDSATNNTSLVFAISVPGKEPKCLLFVADAQVGNWLSWGDQKYKIQGKELIIDDIFAQTVFYKVGHHGSHNATLRDRGLELMTHKNLAGFLPLDEDIAKNKKHWPMPWPALYSTLKAKTGNRLGRSDMADETDASFVHSPVAFKEELGPKPRPIYLEWRVGP